MGRNELPLDALQRSVGDCLIYKKVQVSLWVTLSSLWANIRLREFVKMLLLARDKLEAASASNISCWQI